MPTPTPANARPDISSTRWPYPRWIAHRGAGQLAPENTLAAFRLGLSYGYGMFECDVKLSADGVPFLLHDDSLARTTNAQQAWADLPTPSLIAGHHRWSDLSQLDAGGWHSSNFAGEPLPTFVAVAQFCLRNQCALNVEIKPSPTTARHTGEVVAQHAAILWRGETVKPLLSSFEVDALLGAQTTQPELPRALLLDTLWTGWLEAARQLDCVAIVCNHRLWNADTVALAKRAGFRTLSYTVNDSDTAQHLTALGTDGLITDKIDVFQPTPT